MTTTQPAIFLMQNEAGNVTHMAIYASHIPFDMDIEAQLNKAGYTMTSPVTHTTSPGQQSKITAGVRKVYRRTSTPVYRRSDDGRDWVRS